MEAIHSFSVYTAIIWQPLCLALIITKSERVPDSIGVVMTLIFIGAGVIFGPQLLEWATNPNQILPEHEFMQPLTLLISLATVMFFAFYSKSSVPTNPRPGRRKNKPEDASGVLFTFLLFTTNHHLGENKYHNLNCAVQCTHDQFVLVALSS